LSKKEISLTSFPYLLHPRNTVLVTTVSRDGKPNVLAVAWITPISVNPPYLGISVKPGRYSHKLLLETGEFVVNVPTFDLAREVTICGRKSGRQMDKFKEAGLTIGKAKIVKAPIIKECVAHLECKVANRFEIGDHDFFVGQVLAAYVSEEHFKDLYDVKKHKALLHIGKNKFTTTQDTHKEIEI